MSGIFIESNLVIPVQSFFGISFGGGAEIDIILDDADTRKMAEVKDENGRKERFFLFYDGESVTGKVCFNLSARINLICNYR